MKTTIAQLERKIQDIKGEVKRNKEDINYLFSICDHMGQALNEFEGVKKDVEELKSYKSVKVRGLNIEDLEKPKKE